MRSCTLLCDSSRLLIYHKSEPRTPVLLESGALGILVRAFPVLQHHRTYLLSYTPRVRDKLSGFWYFAEEFPMILSLLFYEFLVFLNNTRFIGREFGLANPQNTQLTN